MSKQTTHPRFLSTVGIAVMAFFSLAIIAFSAPLYHALKGPVTQNMPESPLADGSYSFEMANPDSSGYRDQVSITVANGIITECSWDSFDVQGNGKQKLSAEGAYIMTEDGPTWKAQADSLASWVIKNQSITGLANEEGYASDAISTVSINVSPFIHCMEECLKQAAL